MLWLSSTPPTYNPCGKKEPGTWPPGSFSAWIMVVRQVLGMVGLGPSPDAKDAQIAGLRHRRHQRRTRLHEPVEPDFDIGVAPARAGRSFRLGAYAVPHMLLYGRPSPLLLQSDSIRYAYSADGRVAIRSIAIELSRQVHSAACA
jgi:hypothetical protein